MCSVPEEEARKDLDDDATKNNKCEKHKPHGRDGGLLDLLNLLLELVLRLAAPRLLVLDELGVRPSLLRCLRHCEGLGEIYGLWDYRGQAAMRGSIRDRGVTLVREDKVEAVDVVCNPEKKEEGIEF